MTKLEELPETMYCMDCHRHHFLSINRDIYGKWAIGYVEYEQGSVIPGLALNNSDTIKEAATRMDHAIARYNKRNQGPTHV